MKVLLLHGWGGKKEKHWLTWLENELLSRDIEVFFPKIPNNYNPNLDKWLVHIDNFVKEFQPDTVVAHSLGALAWWHYYYKYHYKLKILISVAPPTFCSFESKMKSFFPLPQIIAKETYHHIICAKNDPNIVLEDISRLASSMNASLLIKEQGEHLDHYSDTVTLTELMPLLF